MARGAIYGGALLGPGLSTYTALGGGGKALGETMTRYAGFGNGKFSWDHLAYHLGPVVAWSLVDMGLSKLGVWKRAGRAMKGLGF